MLLFVILLVQNVVLLFVLLEQTCVLEKPCANSGAKFCDPVCDTSGAKSVILSVLLLVQNVVFLCVLHLVQNVVLLFVLLVQNLAH